jgi:hypothetical protein
MVIVAGHITVDAEQRVNVFERWGVASGGQTFRSSGSNKQRTAMLSVSVAEYDIADVRPLFG